MPPLIVILLTSGRTQYTLQAIEGVHKNLVYQGEWLWYIAGDNASQEHLDIVLDATKDTMIGFHSLQLGYGGAVNYAINSLNDYPVTLLLENDWYLCQQWDLSPYVRLLMEREDVSMIRLGHLPINLDLESYGHNGNMYLNVKKNRQYAFSGNPHLKHRRFYDAYGMYPTGLNPGDTEIAYDSQVRGKDGPMIWWPLSIGDRFLFSHIGQERSY